MQKKYLSEVIGNDYIKWEKGQNVLLSAQTGKGKSYFVMNVLADYCRENNKKILYLVNRTALKKHIEHQIKECGSDDVILVQTYQYLEIGLIDEKKVNHFDYIVCDESHHFFNLSYTRTTDVSLKYLTGSDDAVKIFMTATPWIVRYHFNRLDIKYFELCNSIEVDYDYITDYTCFYKSETINDILEDIINGTSENEKVIVFSTNIQNLLQLNQKFDESAFICSRHNEKYRHYINYNELLNIETNSKFNSKILLCTNAMDNGINIKDKDVRHIIIDIFDRDTFIQCLGRKRIISYDDTVKLYFKNWTNGRVLHGMRRTAEESIKLADLLKDNPKEYNVKQYKTLGFIEKDIIDDELIDEGCYMKVVNECMYTNFIVQKIMIDMILDKRNSRNYLSIIGTGLNVDELKDRVQNYEFDKWKSRLKRHLDAMVGEKLNKDEQKELKNIFKENGLKSRSMGINILNRYLEDNEMDFVIEVPPRKSYRDLDGKVRKENSFWVIVKKKQA